MGDTYRVVMLGPANTGKPFLMPQSMYDDQDEEHIGGTYRGSVMLDGAKVFVQLLDTSGTEGFPAIRDGYVRLGDGFLLVFNINSVESFRAIDEYYEWLVRVHGKNNFLPIILVGNITDDTKSSRQVTVEQGELKARLWSLKYMEKILLTNYNVDKVFLQLLREIRVTKQRNQDAQPKTQLNTTEKSQKRCSVS